MENKTEIEINRLKIQIQYLKEEVDRYRIKNSELKADLEFLKARIDKLVSIKVEGSIP